MPKRYGGWLDVKFYEYIIVDKIDGQRVHLKKVKEY